MLQFFLTSTPIFAVIALGYGAARLRFVSAEGFSAFGTYAFYVALPVLLVQLLARQRLAEAFDPRFFASMLGAGLAVFAATLVVALAVGRTGLGLAGAYAEATTTGNLAFLGVPLVLAILGERAAGPMAMVIVSEVGILMPLGILFMAIPSAGRSSGGRLAADLARTTLLNPIVLGVAAGAALGVLGAKLPLPLERFASFVGASAAPTALFALGGSLAGGRRVMEGWPSLLALTVTKLAVYPAAAWAILKLGFGMDPFWVSAGALIAALPTASNVFVFALRYRAAPERISAEILLCTVVGAFTFPLVAWLLLR